MSALQREFERARANGRELPPSFFQRKALRAKRRARKMRDKQQFNSH